MSEAIRAKRKKLKEDGVDNMVDTTALPQMNPQDILNLKQEAQMADSIDIPEKSSAPDDPADPAMGDSQDPTALKKKMRMTKVFGSMPLK